jgi:3D (Asp-Asp-Asp) domain-containing protein
MPEDPAGSEPETEIAPTATLIPTPTPTPAIERVSLGEFKITAYCPCAKCCGKSDGITSTGAVATEGRTIAVDPRVIPYGSIVEINGAEYVAEDCGGAIKNNRVDMFFESHTAALVWGVKYYEVFLINE